MRTERRDDLLAALKRRDIGPGVHYYPIHLHPYYAERGFHLPVAERVWKEILTLPLYPDLTDAEVDLIADTVVAFGDELTWKTPRIVGPACLLREVESADLPQLRAWRNSPDGLEAFFTRRPISEAEQRAWYDRHLAAVDDLLYVIETRDGRPVGTIGLQAIDREDGVAEIGRFLIGEPEGRGRGLEEAAIATLRDHAFHVIGLHRLHAELKEESNEARARFERCGFAVEGVMRGAYVADGVRRNKLLMACVR